MIPTKMGTKIGYHVFMVFPLFWLCLFFFAAEQIQAE